MRGKRKFLEQFFWFSHPKGVKMMKKKENITCGKKDVIKAEDRLFGLEPRDIKRLCRNFGRLSEMLEEDDSSAHQDGA